MHIKHKVRSIPVQRPVQALMLRNNCLGMQVQHQVQL